MSHIRNFRIFRQEHFKQFPTSILEIPEVLAAYCPLNTSGIELVEQDRASPIRTFHMSLPIPDSALVQFLFPDLKCSTENVPPPIACVYFDLSSPLVHISIEYLDSAVDIMIIEDDLAFLDCQSRSRYQTMAHHSCMNRSIGNELPNISVSSHF